jgi:hypothetical protein
LEVLGLLGTSLSRSCGILASSFSLLLSDYEVNTFALLQALAMVCCLAIGSKAAGPIGHALEPLKLELSLYNLSLYTPFSV